MRRFLPDCHGVWPAGSVRPTGEPDAAMAGMAIPMGPAAPTRPPVPVMALLSFPARATGVAIGFIGSPPIA